MQTVLKKGQLKIQQMAFMLIAVVIFFVLVGLFFLTIKYGQWHREAKELAKEEAIALISKIAESPEFACVGDIAGNVNCIDADKLMVLKDMKVYEKFWPVEAIIIRRIYPGEGLYENEIECTRTNYPDCNTIKLFTKESTAPISTFVALCRKELIEGEVYDKCEIAMLMIKQKSSPAA